MNIILIVLLGLVLTLVESRITRGNLGTTYNGYGAIPGVLDRTALHPMRHRVLMAWIVGWLPETAGRGIPVRALAYQTVKGVFITAALLAAYFCAYDRSMVSVLALALLVMVTMEFDYWDCYMELAGAAVCLTGDVIAATLVMPLWAASRETWAFGALLVALASGNFTDAVPVLMMGGLWYAMVWHVQGPAPLYSHRWAMRAYNWNDLWRCIYYRPDSGPALAILWTLGTLAAVAFGRGLMPAHLARTAWVAVAWLVAGWLMGRAREVRVFLPTAIWMGAVIGRMLTW